MITTKGGVAEPEHPGFTVLIAEDERPLAEALAITLNGEGLHAIVANDGDSALALALGLHPNVLVCDVMMPGMSGIEVCRTLKSHPATASIPVILLTARTQFEDREEGFAAGADEYLTKPFSPLELITLINTVRQGQDIVPGPYRPDPTALSLSQLVIYARELRELYERERAKHRALETAQQRLDELDRLKATFLGTITHELLTPFSTFGLALQLVHKAGEPYPDLQEPLEELGTAMAQIHRKVKGVVKFAELVNKSREPQLGFYDLSAIIPWTLQPLAVMAQSRELDFRVRISPDLPKVQVDAELLAEAVFQMAHNAVKFGQAGGSVQTHVFAREDAVWIEVRDEGPGLTQEQIALLGRPFSITLDALRTGQEGMGIGWTLVSYVAEIHHGGTHVESAGPGQGSQFSLYLPVLINGWPRRDVPPAPRR